MPVQAQNIAGIEIVRDESNALVRIYFNSEINVDKNSIEKFSENKEIRYLAVSECKKFYCELDSDGEIRSAGGDGLPILIFSDSSLDEVYKRKLSLSLNPSVRLSARESKIERCVEVVMYGMGPYVNTDTQSNLKNFIVLLSSSTDPDAPIASVPSSVQEFDIFNDIKKKFGKTYYEYSLGYFRDESDANIALSKVEQRFFTASVMPYRIKYKNQPNADPAELESWINRIGYLKAKLQILNAR